MMSYKKFVSIILIVTCSAATLQFLVPYLSYYTNYTYFSTVACINKDHPAMHCNGSCQLKKMIKQEHHDGRNDKTIINHTNRIDFFFLQYHKLLAKLHAHPQTTFRLKKSFYSLFIGEPTSPPPQIG